MTRALIVASGILLRSRQRPDGLFELQELRYGRRPTTWRVVPESEVHSAANEWATLQGVTLPEVSSCE